MMEAAMLNDEELLRYSRQIMLPEIDAAGQLKLAEASVLIVGLGGLGSSASIYLAAAGVGHLLLVDFDQVDLSNLQRQIVHATGDIGRDKVDSARDHLQSLNPGVRITSYNRALAGHELEQAVNQANIVIDATDNFPARFDLNKACVKTGTPLVSGAAIRFEAQVSVFNTSATDSPCYRCLYSEDDNVDQSCTANGVFSPLLGIIGSIQAAEAMKLIMGIGHSLQGKLLLLDLLNMDWRQTRLMRDPHCPVCNQR